MKEKKQNWRLKKTLSRNVSVRAIEDDDLRYAWAAYKKNALVAMGETFASGEMQAPEFREAFTQFVMTHHQFAWAIVGDTPKGRMPIGFGFGSSAPMAAYLIITGICWFPWASKRNIIEGTVALFSALRKENVPCMGYATREHKRIYEVCCKHGIMNRVGTSHIIFPGEPTAVFETRKFEQ